MSMSDLDRIADCVLKPTHAGLRLRKRPVEEYMARRQIVNELGNDIGFTVVRNGSEPSFTVIAVGPKSEVCHEWTTLEIKALRDMFDQLLAHELPPL